MTPGPRRIVLTGGPGAGKTAVLEIVKHSLCGHVAVTPESASILFTGGFPRDAVEVAQCAAQRAIFHVQLEVEAIFDAKPDVEVVLCDRGTIDGVAYRESEHEDAGDEIVLCDNEFGANAQPWLALREIGVVPRLIGTPAKRMTAAELRAQMTARTRVVAVSWVSFFDGYRHDLDALADVAHERDVKRSKIDALYAGGAKWLLSLPGVSMLYVDRALQKRLAVRWRGWRDVEDIWNFLHYDQPLAPDGSRYEGGTPNFLGVSGLAASMDVIDGAGTDRIAAHVLGLTDYLVERLTEKGATILTERGPGISSGIVTYLLPGSDPVALGRSLGERRVCVTYRPSGIRVSPHGYNTRADVDALIAGLG